MFKAKGKVLSAIVNVLGFILNPVFILSVVVIVLTIFVIGVPFIGAITHYTTGI